MNKAIVVTGGAGFIGCNIVKRLNELGETVFLLLTISAIQTNGINLRVLILRITFKRMSSWKKLSKGIFNGGISVIFHMGARILTTETDIEYLMKNNY